MLTRYTRLSMAFMVLAWAGANCAWAEVPSSIAHQGVISVQGERFTGTGTFHFALVTSSAGVNLWTNDGTQLGTMNSPDAGLTLNVVNGVYNVALGAPPTVPVLSEAFLNDDVLLRIWFDDGRGNGLHQLSPDVVLSSAPYVFRALDSDEAGHALEADNATTVGGFGPRELTPAGSMFAYGGVSAPVGWLVCDGAQVSRATYADLFAAIGTSYGSGDDSTTFHLPDLRGRFARGVSGGSGNDPNATQRTTSNGGGNTGNNVGSLQADATSRPNSNFTTSSASNHTHSISSVSSHSHSSSGGSHTHLDSLRENGNNSPITNDAEHGSGNFLGLLSIPSGGSHGHTIGSAGGHAHSGGSGGGHGHSVTGGGDSETRPANVYVKWIIKH